MREFHLALTVLEHINKHLYLGAHFRTVILIKFIYCDMALTFIANINDYFFAPYLDDGAVYYFALRDSQ